MNLQNDRVTQIREGLVPYKVQHTGPRIGRSSVPVGCCAARRTRPGPCVEQTKYRPGSWARGNSPASGSTACSRRIPRARIYFPGFRASNRGRRPVNQGWSWAALFRRPSRESPSRTCLEPHTTGHCEHVARIIRFGTVNFSSQLR